MARPHLKGIRMTPKKSPEVLQKEALTVLVQWRGADKESVADKGNDGKKRAEYRLRKHLRTAADNLAEVPRG